MIHVEFEDCREIRMGAPYNVCDIRLSGEWTPTLIEYDWQDRCAYSLDGRYLGLIAWDVDRNEPGFKVIVLDARERRIFESERIEGCCVGLYWQEAGFQWETSSQNEGRFKPS